MQKEGKPEGVMTIRVFYLGTMPGKMDPSSGSIRGYRDYFSEVFTVSYLWKNDPIYHELVFVDDKGVRHQFIGLPYHVEEKMPASCGIDGQA
jgi:hypothetical protein